MDKEKMLIKSRLFRDHCYEAPCHKGSKVFIKDLRIFEGVDPRNIVIVDNCLFSYGFQLNNGMPILPYYNDKYDTELVELEKFLLSLVTSYDIRPRIEEHFLLRLFEKNYHNQLELIKKLFSAICK